MYHRIVALMIASDGLVTTTAAFSAVHDLALRIIQIHAGDDLARHVARMSLIADNRTVHHAGRDDAGRVPAPLPHAAVAV